MPEDTDKNNVVSDSPVTQFNTPAESNFGNPADLYQQGLDQGILRSSSYSTMRAGG